MALVAPVVLAEDWPQILGPRRDGVYRGDDVVTQWPDGGPKTLWTKKVGRGLSGPVVSDGKLVLFQRIGDDEVVECLDSSSGKSLWTQKYPTTYHDDFGFDDGPRAMPTVSGGRVFTYGAQGVLSCFALSDGKKSWSVPTHERFGVRKGYFGAACSPAVHAGRVLVNVGGTDGAGIVSFDAKDGSVLWKATSDEAGYSSPVVAEIEGEPHAFFFTRKGLVDVDPRDGRVRFDFRWRARIQASVNAATPLVVGNRIFVSSSYQTGARLVRVQGDAYEEIWSGDASLSNHYATSIHRDGFLYGFDGRQEYRAALRCIELETGKVRWSEDRFGCGSIIAAGDILWIVTDDGQLTLARSSPDGFQRLGRASILDGTVRALPALAQGRLYARNEDTLICLDLRRRKKET